MVLTFISIHIGSRSWPGTGMHRHLPITHGWADDYLNIRYEIQTKEMRGLEHQHRASHSSWLAGAILILIPQIGMISNIAAL
jgi:hypothetical protein